MNPFAIPPLTTSILVFLLGLFVFLKNRKEKPNLIFFLEALSISSWLYFDYLMYSGVLPKARFFLVKAAYIPVILIPLFFFHFSLSFLLQLFPQSSLSQLGPTSNPDLPLHKLPKARECRRWVQL